MYVLVLMYCIVLVYMYVWS